MELSLELYLWLRLITVDENKSKTIKGKKHMGPGQGEAGASSQTPLPAESHRLHVNALQSEMRLDSWCEMLPTREAPESLRPKFLVGAGVAGTPCLEYTQILDSQKESSIVASTTLFI